MATANKSRDSYMDSPESNTIQSGSYNQENSTVVKAASQVSKALAASLVACIGFLSFGYGLGYTSPIQNEMEDTERKFHFTVDEFTWFASLLSIGALTGSLIGGWMSNSFGRKTTIILLSAPLTLGWCLIAFVDNVAAKFAGRIFVGMGVGVASPSVPVYIAEIAPTRWRGAMVSLSQIAVFTGIVIAYIIGERFSWQWSAIAGIVLVVLLVILMLKMPETPKWLFVNNRKNAARKELKWLLGDSGDIDHECKVIEESIVFQERPHLRDLMQPRFRRPLVIACGLFSLQQFCGINAVLFYNAKIFTQAGVKDPELISILVSIAQLASCLVTVLLVDRLGRKVLLLTSTMGMCICLLLLGVYFDLVKVPDSEKSISIFGHWSHTYTPSEIEWLSIGSIVLYVIFFAVGMGPLPAVIMSEVAPSNAGGIVTAFATCSNWLACFVVTKIVDWLFQTLYQQGTFFLFAGFCLISFFFTVFIVVETKGKTLEEIERTLSDT